LVSLREGVLHLSVMLDACQTVQEHLFEGHSECPIDMFCWNCPSQCRFSKSYTGNLMPKTAKEYHLILYQKWKTLILIQKLHGVIKQLERRVEELEAKLSD
jgi:hypothetical protein